MTLASGLEAIKARILWCLEHQDEINSLFADGAPQQLAGNTPPLETYDDIPDSPRPIEPVVARFSLDELIQRFSLAMPDGKIWDASKSQFVKVGAAKSWWGEKLYKLWVADNRRSTVDQEDVRIFAAAAATRRRGGLQAALDRYILIYPTDTVWDVVRRERVPIGAIKLAIADVYDDWIKHDKRREIDDTDVVFDPVGPLEQAGRINTFRGLPMQPIDDENACSNIRTLLWQLANQDEAIYWWIAKWLALPLQKVGTKMASALLIHSETHGTGKSLLFEEVIKAIYGDYGATLGQHQLEGQYSDWRSRNLFALFEEVFSRQTRFNFSGQLKHMVTGKTQRIEKKFVSGWEEANHMNAVFLSNETQPFPIERSDRRFLVVWPREKLPAEVFDGVLDEVRNGRGVPAFLGWLLSLDLGAFHSHTEPIMTEAKQRIIDLGLPGWDLFYQEWREGALPVPFQTCLVMDLYQLYERWAKPRGEHVVSYKIFAGSLAPRMSHRKDCPFDDGLKRRKGTFFIVDAKPEETTQERWLGQMVCDFQSSMDACRDDRL
jgi:putative DNA primase/helicase